MNERRIALSWLLGGILMAAIVATPSLASAQSELPLDLPFDTPPGPDTWLLAQPYGNTIMAYWERDGIYSAGQGIHFGVDLSAACGKPVVAMADGVVFAVDEMRFGSAPHNLMIDHPDLGYSTFYGHLLEPPNLVVGQEVKAGQPVGLSGDPAETCYGRPHLHFEIRDLNHWRKYNPTILVKADWQSLALVGPFRSGFQRDLDYPRQWQYLDDQPEIVVGGPLLNDFTNPWPPDRRRRGQTGTQDGGISRATDTSNAATSTTTSAESSLVQEITNPVAPNAASSPALLPVTSPDCCTQPFWNQDSNGILFIDKPTSTSPSGIWGVFWESGELEPRFVTNRVGYYSDDLNYLVEIEDDSTFIERLNVPLGDPDFSDQQDNLRWEVPAGGNSVSISPDQTKIAWQESNSNLPIERQTTQIWVAQLDGSDPRQVATLNRGGVAGWIDQDTLLISGRPSLESREQVLYGLDLDTENMTELLREEGLRNMRLSPDGTWLAYLVTFRQDTARNGLWVIRTDGSERQQIDRQLFGGFQWRDDNRLLLIPLESGASGHEVWEWNVNTRTSRRLTDSNQSTFTIANGDWTVSPDGRQIAFVDAGQHNVWILALPD